MKRMSDWRRAALWSLCLILSAGVALAGPPEGKGKGGKPRVEHHTEKGAHQGGSGGGSGDGGHLQGVVETGVTLGVVEGLLGRDLAPLQVDAQPLPPGIRKNLARGKPLPPGLAKKQVAPELTERLPHYDGYEWVRVGTDLVLVGIVSGVVSDLVRDVFR